MDAEKVSRKKSKTKEHSGDEAEQDYDAEKAALEAYLDGGNKQTGKAYSKATRNTYGFAFEKLGENAYSHCEVPEKKRGSYIINTMPENVIIDVANTQQSKNSVQSLLNIAIIIKKIYEKPHQKLIDAREINKKEIAKQVKTTNARLVKTLPDYADLANYLEAIGESDGKDNTTWITNYLLINYNVRNEDLNFKYIKLKKDADDENTNYMWLPKDRKKAVWIRRNYKTFNIHGEKKITITDPEIINAMGDMAGKMRWEGDGDNFWTEDPEEQINYRVQSRTFKKIGEGAYMKIMVDTYRGDLQKLKEMSWNRGTDVNTIISNYDIDNV